MSSKKSPIYLIAEAGVNHNGDKDLAFQLIDVAVSAGADAVKFQTFKAENLVTASARKANYQARLTDREESQFEMLKRLELSQEVFFELEAYCRERDIDFLSTAFDEESLDFLFSEMKLQTFKIPSGEITNAPLLLAYAMTGCNLILSTGMSSLKEIELALGAVAYGFLFEGKLIHKPSIGGFKEAYLSDEGQRLLKERVSLLHCTTEYPAPVDEINLNAMITMRDSFGLKVGYSDHSEGITIPIAAAAMGARIIEKHFTLDRDLPGPDHMASLEPEELRAMVSAIRAVEIARGCGDKKAAPSEQKNRAIVRKGLYANRRISQGKILTEHDIAVKRPENGISPFHYWERLGEVASYDYEIDQPLEGTNEVSQIWRDPEGAEC